MAERATTTTSTAWAPRPAARRAALPSRPRRTAHRDRTPDPRARARVFVEGCPVVHHPRGRADRVRDAARACCVVRSAHPAGALASQWQHDRGSTTGVGRRSIRGRPTSRSRTTTRPAAHARAAAPTTTRRRARGADVDPVGRRGRGGRGRRHRGRRGAHVSRRWVTRHGHVRRELAIVLVLTRCGASSARSRS